MKPATDWKEIVPEGEGARFERHAEALRDLQRKRAKGGRTERALHAKGNAGVEAELAVLSNLPEYARIGLFAEPGTYKAYVRFSNGSGAVQHDAKGDVRGVAVKVVGAPGKKIIPGLEDAKTQDFLLIKSPATPFRDADEFVSLVVAAANPITLLPMLIGQRGLRGAFRFLKKLSKGVSQPITSVATTGYYSALPIKYGPYAVHYALRPHAAPEPGAKKGVTPDYLGEDLAARLRKGPIVYDFRVQFFINDKKTPIEDASVEWKEEDAPFLTIARLTLPQQDMGSARGRKVASMVEAFSFDPWHATEDFRPLGNMMRARNHAYRLSTQERGAAAEPDGTETLD
jgi:Catalase